MGDSPVGGNVNFRLTKGLPSPAKESNRRFDSRYQVTQKEQTTFRCLLFLMVPLIGVEPIRGISPLDFESSASANFTTAAKFLILSCNYILFLLKLYIERSFLSLLFLTAIR